MVGRSTDSRFHRLTVSLPPFTSQRQSDSDAKSTAGSKSSRALGECSHVAERSHPDPEENAIGTFVAFEQIQIPYPVLSDEKYGIEQAVCLERTVADSTHPEHQFGYHKEDQDGQGKGNGPKQEALDSRYGEMSEDEEEEGGIRL